MFNTIDFIRQLISFSPRQGSNETRAGKFITDLLGKNNVEYKLQQFTVTLPQDIKAELIADGRHIPCQASSFVSGKIEGKNNLISSLLFDLEFNFPNLNFNPRCEQISVPSRSMHFPALAVSKNDLPKILTARQVRGEVVVKPVKHQSQNILVGSLKNPKNIIFTHYDSINLGVYDNAAGVACAQKLILKQPKLLQRSLFVISGNEELSYDFPTYWGYGYRVFEKKYLNLLEKTKKIIIIDGVGNGQLNFINDPYWLNMGFPIKNVKKFQNKTILACSDSDRLMTVYHSDADNLSQFEEKYFNDAYQKIKQQL